MRNSNDKDKEADRLLTVLEVAGRLSLSRATVYVMMDRGELPYVKLGSSRRVKAAAVADLIERNTRGGDVR